MDTPKNKEKPQPWIFFGEYHVYVSEKDITATAIAEAENQIIMVELEEQNE